MPVKNIILIGICAATLAHPTQPAPFAGECHLLDRVFDAAHPPLRTAGTALRILELVALGRMNSADSELEKQIGLPAGSLRGRTFADSSVREYALRRIAKVDLSEALDFLENLKKEDLDPDPSARVWPSVAIAVHEARLKRIPGHDGQIAFLEATLREWNAAVAWAADELCNRGSYGSLPLIRRSVHQRLSTQQDAEDEVGYCEARISILSRNPDPVAALGSFLNTSETVSSRRLTVWAIKQLYSLDSPRADAELDRYRSQLQLAVPTLIESQEKRHLMQTCEEIETLLANRKK